MGWFFPRTKVYISTNCTGAIATIALTAVIFGTLLILKYAAPLPGAWEGRVREYYIAAEEELWDYTPLMQDPETGAHWNASGIHSARRKRDALNISAAYNEYDLGALLFAEQAQSCFELLMRSCFCVLSLTTLQIWPSAEASTGSAISTGRRAT